jgi:hypothetical protein
VGRTEGNDNAWLIDLFESEREISVRGYSFLGDLLRCGIVGF